MQRNDEDEINVPLSSSAKALEGKQMHAREKQKKKQRDMQKKRELLKLKVTVQPPHAPQNPASASDAPTTFGTKTREQIVQEQEQPAAQETITPDALIRKAEEHTHVRKERPYEEQQQGRE